MHTIKFLRTLGKIEGISYILLLAVAMPLKWVWGMPMAVKIVGWAHGVLFVWLCWVLLMVMIKHQWPLSRAAMVFIAALLPFGPFIIDRKLAAEDVDGEQNEQSEQGETTDES